MCLFVMINCILEWASLQMHTERGVVAFMTSAYFFSLSPMQFQSMITFDIKCSSLGRYIGIEENGLKISGGNESVAANRNNFVFVNETRPDGRWAFKNLANNLYLGGVGEKLDCYSKEASEDRLWTVVLAIHPQ